MTGILRTVYRFWAAILFLAVLAQVGAAGYGAFNADHLSDKSNALTHRQFDHGFGLHTALGYLIFLAGLLLFLVALGARLGRRGVLLALGVPLLVFLAIVLALVGHNTPAVGVLHPVDAFLVVGLTGYLAHQAWTGRGHTAP